MNPKLELIYNQLHDSSKAMAPHMPTLRKYAEECDTAVEFGVNAGCSTVSILLGTCLLTSYDVREHRWHRKIKDAAGDLWDFRLQSSLEGEPQESDMLFVDSLHNYDQVKGELDRHGDFVRKYIIFHDTITFGVVGADGDTGRQKPGVTGIMPAIMDWMDERPVWSCARHDTNSHGFMVWERRP
jgi:hypothetical protein